MIIAYTCKCGKIQSVHQQVAIFPRKEKGTRDARVEYLFAGCERCHQSAIWAPEGTSISTLRGLKRHVRWETGGKFAEEYGRCRAKLLPEHRLEEMKQLFTGGVVYSA